MASSGNICTLNPLTQPNSGTFSEGNLLFTHTSSAWRTTAGTHGMRTGKWYWESYQYESLSGNGFPIGIYDIDCGQFVKDQAGSYPDGNTSRGPAYTAYSNSGTYASRYNAGTETNTTLGIGVSGDVWQCALDLDNGKIWFGKNNTWDNSGNPATGSNPSYSGGQLSDSTIRTWVPVTCSYNDSSSENFPQNFGQDSTFSDRISAGGNADDNGFGDFKYAPPSGFLTLCSGNLTISADIDPAETNTDFPLKQFNAFTYTGNGSDGHAISGVGFQPDFVWVKNRSAANSHQMYDSSRGTGKLLSSDNSDAEQTYSTVLQSFDSDGFTAGTSNGINGSGNNLVAWCWKANGGTTASNSDGDTASTVQANTKAGFSIIQFTGFSGSSGTSTIGHGLTQAPEFIIHKSLARGGSWWCQHVGLSAPKMTINLNSSGAEADYSSYGTLSAPTNSVLSINGIDGIGGSGGAYICYAWHSVDGYSKFGVYEGNSNADGPFVYTGFRPRMLFIKNIDGTAPWVVWDAARGPTNETNNALAWNGNNSEADYTGYPIDIYASGFKLRSSNATINASNTWIYGAWGEVPYRYNNAR